MPLKPQRFSIRNTFKNTPRWFLTISFVLFVCLGIYAATHLSILRAQAAANNFRFEAISTDNLHVKLEGQESLKAEFIGDEIARNLLEQNQAQALALASADFDEDGMPDLVTGYGYSGGGVLSINRGNLAAAYPQYRADRSQLESNAAAQAPAFLSPGKVWSLSDSADFVVAGDFNADGHFDVVVGTKGKSELYLLAGNGKGQLAEAQKLTLPGRLTNLVSGDVNRADGLADLVLGLESDNGARVLVYESPQGAWNAEPEVFKLNQTARALTIGRINSDSWNDLAIAAGQELMIVQGRDRKLLQSELVRSQIRPATVERTSFSGEVRALAIGNFTDRRHSQVAVLLDSGAVYMASDKPDQTAARRSNVGRSISTTLQSELYRDAGSSDSTGLLRAKVSSSLNDDLIVFGAGNRRLEVLGRNTIKSSNAETSFDDGQVVFELDSPLINAIPMRLNGDALSDLVVLRQGISTPAFIESQPEATFTVTSNGDNGPGTLRDAILNANRNAGADIILFSVSSGAQTITVTSQLPVITEAVTIDATSQPGFAGAPLIQLRPSTSPSPVFGAGLVLTADGSTIRGLVINQFNSNGIQIFSSNNVIEGNYIGTDLTGSLAVPNGNSGILIDGSNQTASNNRIGGTVAAARNVISGNSNNGVDINASSSFGASFSESSSSPEATSGNTVQGNYIGVNAAGDDFLSNQFSGVSISNSTNNVIGGTVAGARNVISGNNVYGVGLSRNFTFESTAGNLIQGNYIGVDSAGSSSLPNINGIYSTGESSTIGGTSAAARNVISGNEEDGIRFDFDRATNNVVAGNYIGTNAAGTGALGNGLAGVIIGNFDSVSSPSNNNLVGGTSVAAGNVIAFNGGDGVAIGNGSGNAILTNSIFENADLGINLSSGSNNNQAAPALTSAVLIPTGVIVSGTLNSTANLGFTIQFFTNATCDSSGFGEGQTFIGQTTGTTDANGTLNFTVTLTAPVTAGQVITATATSSANNTSEFSACRATEERADLSLTKVAAPTNPAASSTVTYTLTVTNNGPSNASVITVTDTLPTQLTNIGCSATNGGVCSGSGNVRTISFASLSAVPGSNTATITLTGTVPCQTQSATLGNTASVITRSLDTVTSNNTASANIQVQAGVAAVTVTPDSGSAINLGPIVAGSGATPPSATFTITSTGCLPVNFGLATIVRDVGTNPPANSFGSLDDSKYYRLSIVNNVNNPGQDTVLTPDSAGNYNVNRTISSGQTLKLRVAFNPPFPDFAGRFAGRNGTITAGQFLPDVVNSKFSVAFNGNDPSNPAMIGITGRVSPNVQIVTREGFVIPASAATASTESVNAFGTEATPLVLFQRVRDELRVAVSLYDSNLNITKVTYQFLTEFGLIASDPIEVPLTSAIQQSGLVKGQSFTLVQAFLGAEARPYIQGVRVTVMDADNATATAQSIPAGTSFTSQITNQASLERDPGGAVIQMPLITLSSGLPNERLRLPLDGAKRTRKE